VLVGDGGGGRAGRGNTRGVLTEARVVVKRRHDGGKERWRFELIVRAKEGTQDLGREGKSGSEGRGLSYPFIGAEGAPGRGGQGGNGDVNGFNTIEDGARLRGGR
jgi:hypothetical protein